MCSAFILGQHIHTEQSEKQGLSWASPSRADTEKNTKIQLWETKQKNPKQVLHFLPMHHFWSCNVTFHWHFIQCFPSSFFLSAFVINLSLSLVHRFAWSLRQHLPPPPFHNKAGIISTGITNATKIYFVCAYCVPPVIPKIPSSA